MPSGHYGPSHHHWARQTAARPGAAPHRWPSPGAKVHPQQGRCLQLQTASASPATTLSNVLSNLKKLPYPCPSVCTTSDPSVPQALGLRQPVKGDRRTAPRLSTCHLPPTCTGLIHRRPLGRT